MGMTGPGKVMLSTGTAWVLQSVVEAETTQGVPEWVNLYYHAVPGKRLGGQLVGGFGATVDWYLRQSFTGQEAVDPPTAEAVYESFNQAVRDSLPGSQGLLFLSLSGPSQIMNAAPGGGFIGLSLAHTRADMARSLLEGCAYEVRWALDELRATGVPVQELWLAGGANRSPVWPQILADVCGVPLQISTYANWAALGAATLAGWGIGAYASLEEGLARLQPSSRKLNPDPALSGLYKERLEAYQRASAALNRTANRA